MIELTDQNIKDLTNWCHENWRKNWGSWNDDYPDLPVGASYLQYEDIEVKINLDQACTYRGVEFVSIIKSKRKLVPSGSIAIGELYGLYLESQEKELT